MEKGTKSCKSGLVVGVQCRGVGTPHRREGPRHGLACHAMAWPNGEFGHSRVRRGEAHCSQRGKLLCFVMFHFSIAPRTFLLDK